MPSSRFSVARSRSFPAGLAAVLLVVLAVLASTAQAAPASLDALPAGTPNLARIALGPADLPGAKVERQRYVADPDGVAGYAREFKSGVVLGRGIALSLENDIDAFSTSKDAQAFFLQFKRVFGSAEGRRLFKQQIIAEIKRDKSVKGVPKVTFGRFRVIAVGDETFVQALNVTAGALRLPFTLSLSRRDRITSSLFVLGLPGVPIAIGEIAKLQRLVVVRIATALTPVSTALPTAAGVPAAGQILTGADGTFTNAPTGFTRSWLRCDATGAACVAIPGATTETYTVAPEDVGLTIRYSVVATNAVGSSVPAISDPTAIVTAVPPPPAP